ncbi:hypothetical protein [Streptomyces similanensis]|uniref:Uncharacterized protein n=1 Tax=Streptomyces similanensis TaxID=1274988 RepID=A0ABP9KES5_9ACTN
MKPQVTGLGFVCRLDHFGDAEESKLLCEILLPVFQEHRTDRVQEIASVLIGEVREEGVDELSDNHPLGLWMPLLVIPDDLLDVDAR